MVDLNPAPGPEMTEVGGQQFRPEDVDAAKARLAAREAFPQGAVDPTPIGVATPTTNRRQTFREVALANGDEGSDPAATILSREGASDVGVPVAPDADPVTVATSSGTKTKPTRTRAGASDAS